MASKESFNLKICRTGTRLLKLFLILMVFATVLHAVMIPFIWTDHWMSLIISCVIWVLAEALIFWTGIICVYSSSVQLGIKIRVLGALFGMVPIANLIMLRKIIKTVDKEIEFETEKIKLNDSRKDEKICKTRYPILLVHGVFFRDSRYFNYWGWIPKELERNGASVYYGNHQSAASVKDSAAELAARIEKIVTETGCEKVNLIAHSKGGLDCRFLISETDAGRYVASLTTVNTPHKGCRFADVLLNIIPEKAKNKVADTYNTALKKFGDEDPDFLAAVSDLTAQSCKTLNESLKTPDGIYCQSIGSRLNKASNGKFPLNMSYGLVHLFDGPNDGLVSEGSFEWGEKYTLLTIPHKRGISHGDVIDLNRENIADFDVREFYAELVHGLKEKGL